MSSPLRLLFISHSFPPPGRPQENIGGMQRVATELYAALCRHPGAVVTPLILQTSWRTTHLRAPYFLLHVVWVLRRFARAHRVDAVLFSSMVTASMALPLRRLLRRSGIRTAVITHGRDVTLPFGPYQRLVRRVFDSVDLILPVSRATAEACHARGAAPERVVVVNNGVDLNRFETDLDHAEARQILGVPDSCALLLCSVGRQMPRKGFAWFVEHVMPLLPSDVSYWLAGEGPEQENIVSAARRAGVSDRVRLLGRVTDEQLHTLYRAADLFVMPNIPVPGDMEGFGVVMLEAGVTGLPSIGSDLEGIRDVIAEAENGHLVSPGDAAAFADRIERYLDQEARLAFSDRAQRYVRQTFSWDAIAERYLTALKGVSADQS